MDGIGLQGPLRLIPATFGDEKAGRAHQQRQAAPTSAAPHVKLGKACYPGLIPSTLSSPDGWAKCSGACPHHRKSPTRSREPEPRRSEPGCAANLLLLLEERLIREEGIRDEVEEKKQIGRTCPTRPKPGKPKIMKVVEIVRNFINSAVTRATQRTQRFVRWVRVRIYHRVLWRESVARLRELWTLPA